MQIFSIAAKCLAAADSELMASREKALRLPFILNVPIPPEPGAAASTGLAADARGSTTDAKRARSSEDKRKKRMCKVNGCTKYLVHRGLCCRHGVRFSPLGVPTTAL